MAEVGRSVFLGRADLGSGSGKLGYGEAHPLLGDVVCGEEALEEHIAETEDGEGLATRGVAMCRMGVRRLRLRGWPGARRRTRASGRVRWAWRHGLQRAHLSSGGTEPYGTLGHTLAISDCHV
jgi:hypothetical protein